MGQQARSEATRRKILIAGMELFDEVGYTNTGLGDIIERAQLTKGALYYHFDSKESLAEAIIAEGAAAVLAGVTGVRHSASPALENLIHGSFLVAGIVTNNPMARTASQLMRALGQFNRTATATYSGIQALLTDVATQASVDGDLLPSVDPEALAELLTSSYLGAELLAIGTSAGDDLASRISRHWKFLLPSITDPDALAYFQEFLQREALRTSATKYD
jgi:AcrR family transcriptional regulator